MKLADVVAFVKKQNLAVVATTKDNVPQAAVVEFGELDDLTIVIDTLTTSRKYKNLKTNDKVAIVIGWDNDITVQINAVAKELSGDELAVAKQTYFAKNPRAKKWEHKPDIAYFAFKPYWVRYSDVGQNPWVIEEFNMPT